MDIIHSMYTEHILQNLRENNMPSLYRYKITWQLTRQHLAYMCMSITGNKFNQSFFFIHENYGRTQLPLRSMSSYYASRKKAVW